MTRAAPGITWWRTPVRKIDGINPQVAARLLGSFGNWRMMEPSRRAKAKDALAALVKDKRLSRDVIEIAQTAIS